MAGYVKPTRQPQGALNLVRGSRLLIGAQAILLGNSPSNLVTGVPLITAGPATKGAVAPANIADNFRKNSYRTTELLAAVGTADFVEFWCGYPRAFGTAGNSSEAAFVTGSSTDLTGIMLNMRAGNGPNWGCVYMWSGLFNDSGETLALDKFTILLMARYQNRMELWRDGRLIASFTQSPQSYPASKLVIGSFLEDISYWTSSSDTIFAGRVLNTWSAGDIRSFMLNPWQIFQGQQRRLLVDAPVAVGTNLIPDAGALTLAGFAPSVSQPQTISPGPAAVAITGYAPSVNQSTTLMPIPGALALTGYAPAVTQPKTLTPGAGALAISGFAPSVSQNVQLSPTPGALVITGRAPTISQPRTVTPGPVALAFIGYAPSISQSYLPPANEFYTTIMRVSTVYADAGAPSTDINVSGQIDGALFLTTIMRASTVNGTGNMSAAPINLTGNLL